MYSDSLKNGLSKKKNKTKQKHIDCKLLSSVKIYVIEDIYRNLHFQQKLS